MPVVLIWFSLDTTIEFTCIPCNCAIALLSLHFSQVYKPRRIYKCPTSPWKDLAPSFSSLLALLSVSPHALNFSSMALSTPLSLPPFSDGVRDNSPKQLRHWDPIWEATPSLRQPTKDGFYWFLVKKSAPGVARSEDLNFYMAVTSFGNIARDSNHMGPTTSPFNKVYSPIGWHWIVGAQSLSKAVRAFSFLYWDSFFVTNF